jgi:hypothetical protein
MERNPASAQMVGMKVVVIKCDEHGNVDIEDLKEKAKTHSENLAALNGHLIHLRMEFLKKKFLKYVSLFMKTEVKFIWMVQI